VSGIATRLGREPHVRVVRETLAGEPAWLVGGTVRDVLLERRLEDLDVVVVVDPERAARRLAAAVDGHVFPLSERFGAWRVIAQDRSWQADLTPVRGSIEEDLALRDFTINAMAIALPDSPDLLDPHGGEADLSARAIRAVGRHAFSDDPLRTLRLARFACELGFEPERGTRELAAAEALRITEVAPERCFHELRRLVVSDDPRRGIDLMDATGLVGPLLPELEGLKGVEQNRYHHLDVWGHTLEVLERLVEVERDPEPTFGALGEAIAAELARPLADDLTRGQALRLGALLHDAGKPATRAVTDEGRVLFWGHDGVGAEMARAFARRMHASVALAEYLAALAQHHLRLGFLVHERALSPRHVYRYLRACEPVEVEVTVLSVADRLATMGPRTKRRAVESHVALARDLAAQALEWRAAPGAPAPVRGDDLIADLGIEQGPEVGRLLELIEEAVFVGEVRSREDALALARREAGSRAGAAGGEPR
jgi:putative nucleotidyltransferase with HDIG domain